MKAVKRKRSRVDLEDVEEWLRLDDKINSLSLEDIDFYQHGEKLDLSIEEVREFKYTGLNIIDFACGKFLQGED